MCKKKKSFEARSFVFFVFSLLACPAGAMALDQTCAKFHNFGGPFIVYRTSVAQHLNLSEAQRQTLLDDESLFVNSGASSASAQQQLWHIVNQLLDSRQLTRLQQLSLQHDGVTALLKPEYESRLAITQTQKQQIIQIATNMQSQIRSLTQQTRLSGNPNNDAWSKGAQIFTDGEKQVDSILTDSQRTHWQSMLGTSFPELFNPSCIGTL